MRDVLTRNGPATGAELFFREMRAQLAEKIGETKPPVGYVPWREQARPNQLPPTWDWFVWLLLAGRGFGKTRTGAEWAHREAMAGDERRWIALVGRTPGDARDVMLNGPGGLLTNAPEHQKPTYTESRRELRWPTGARATIFSGANPEQLRGFSGDRAWVDELASFDRPEETWSNLMFGMREAQIDAPQVCVTTTPRPIQVLKDLLEARDDFVHLTTGSSYDNRENLSKRYYDVVIRPYEGTRLGRQEIHAELLEDVEGALWSLALLDRTRFHPGRPVPELDRVAISVDPAVSANPDSDETGITVLGTGWCDCKQLPTGPERHGFLLDDLSGVYTPKAWGELVVSAFYEWEADFVIGEVNNGGDLVERNVQAVDEDVPFQQVRASRGKYTRAEPVATKYEKQMVHHVGTFVKLEDQLTTWVPKSGQPSPDRMDSTVHGFTKLLLDGPRLLDEDLENWGHYRPSA